jgi:hypothetical protein
MLFLDEFRERLRLNIAGLEETNLAAALADTDHNVFFDSTAPLADAMLLVANVRFVHLDDAIAARMGWQVPRIFDGGRASVENISSGTRSRTTTGWIRQLVLMGLRPEATGNGRGLRYGSPLVASISRSTSRLLRCFRSLACLRAKPLFFLSPGPGLTPGFPVCAVHRFVESLTCPMPPRPLKDE